MFLSASLLFTRVVLPHVGGSPAVWTKAMMFFRAVLIAGYLYAHLLARALPVRGQVLVHLGRGPSEPSAGCARALAARCRPIDRMADPACVRGGRRASDCPSLRNRPTPR